MRKIKEWKNSLILVVGYLAVVTVLWLFQVPCLFRHFFGVICPGCGMTRAMMAVLRLDFAAAFSYHPMFWSMPILFVYYLFNGRLLSNKYFDYAILGGIALGFLVSWLIRLI